MKVSKSSEKAMLNTVRMLRRLLRNAFLVTNRVNVIGVLQGDPEKQGRSGASPSPHRIDDVPGKRQPHRSNFAAAKLREGHGFQPWPLLASNNGGLSP